MLDFRTAISNNGLINFYMNDTMKNIESLSDWQSRISAKLETFFPESMELLSFANKSNFDNYLVALSIGRLEYTLNDIRRMLSDQQKSQLIGMAAQLLVEAAIDRLVTSLKKAYDQIYYDDIFYGSQLREMLGGYEKKTKMTFKEKLTVVPKVFKQMAKNVKNTLASVKNRITGTFKNAFDRAKAIKKAMATEGWKSLKGKLKGTINKAFNKFKAKVISLRKSFKPKIKPLESFTMSKIPIQSVLGLVADAVAIGLTMHAWKEKDEEVEKARHRYDTYLRRLRMEKSVLNSEIVKIKREWKIVISDFKRASKSFDSIMGNLTKYSDFIDVIGLSKLAINNTKHFLSVDFQNARRENIIHYQQSVIHFLRGNDQNLTSINEALRARNILYDSVIRDSRKNKGVLQMTEFLHNLYRFDASDDVRRFGQKLRKKDVVCTVAILRQDKKEYDYYPLLPFRPKCDVNETLYAKMDKRATKQQNMKIMNDVIDSEFESKSVIGLPEMLATIRKTYRLLGQELLIKFAKTITEKDILCRIARKYTTLAEYDFIPLSHFRTAECHAISQEDLKNIKEKASKGKKVHENMRSFMNMCKKYQMCYCISTISTFIGANQNDIKAAIKRMDPERKRYCGNSGCKCIDL